ncbi:hypothetical protein P4O66_013952 [Electrophorus voltai]|uniref:Uncharacterized protein n=1 Tax=Electrophorus voltai TaxID=2609070 RepID=A0AAD8Z003_9TELE|nr:hypothetical protein P4O66_013952 [Electrophorus voltai]
MTSVTDFGSEKMAEEERNAKAEKLKEKANNYFKEKDYENAIRYYTEALELNPSNAIYFSNRSLAYLRTECYGYALADATHALEIDKNYIKGYYRRATSNMALGKFKAALKDYETVSPMTTFAYAWGCDSRVYTIGL